MTDEATTPDTEVTHQPTLPTLELPDYHGRLPAGMKTALSGAGNRIARPHSLGDRVVLVVEAKVKKAGHEETDDGLIYVEALKVLDLFELDRDQGSRLISSVRSAYRTADDMVKGKTPLPNYGEVGYTDASGVVLTPAEVASLRGDPIRVLATEALTPAVVVYSDATRELWPDEFPKDAPRPHVGETYHGDSGPLVVERLLHHETGEELGATAPATASCECGHVPDLFQRGTPPLLVDGVYHRLVGPCYDAIDAEEPPVVEAAPLEEQPVAAEHKTPWIEKAFAEADAVAPGKVLLTPEDVGIPTDDVPAFDEGIEPFETVVDVVADTTAVEEWETPETPAPVQRAAEKAAAAWAKAGEEIPLPATADQAVQIALVNNPGDRRLRARRLWDLGPQDPDRGDR